MLDGISVRLQTPTIDRDVTHLVAGELGFTTQAPGGEVQCSFRLAGSRVDFPDLGPMTRVWVSDTRGNLLWGPGYGDNPGEQYDGTLGFDLTFRGGLSTAEDDARELLYRDTSFENWEADDSGLNPQAASADAAAGNFPDATEASGLILQFNPGQPIGPGSEVGLIYRASVDMGIGAWAFATRGGTIDAGYTLQVDGGGTRTRTLSLATTGMSLAPVSSPTNVIRARFRRTGAATNVAFDTVWIGLGAQFVLGQMLDRFGQARSMGTAPVFASEVATDVLARLLPSCDAASAEIVPSSFPIDQLAYFDGAHAATVLDDLVGLEPDYLWWIGGGGSDAGHSFRFAPWPTRPRYELWSDDGVTFPGSESDLCDRVTVFYTDEKGRKRSTLRVTTDPVVLARLDGRKRSAPTVTLPDGLGSQANAEKAGDAILANSNAVAQAGSVTVRRPIRDLITGEWHDPAALRAGELARVADLGITQRVTATDATVSRSGQENALTLGTPVRSFVDLASGQRVHRWALPS